MAPGSDGRRVVAVLGEPWPRWPSRSGGDPRRFPPPRVVREGPPAGGGGSADRIRAAAEAILLDRLAGVGPARYRVLVDHFGDAGAALSADDQAFAALVGTRATAARRRVSPGVRRAARRTAEHCARAGINVLLYGAASYPPRLTNLPDPPPVLYALGRTDLLRGPCVAVVGSRAATVYGRRVARSLGAMLAGNGSCVVSGMALGIDGEAHRGALPGPTAAVLGSGVDVASPPSQAGLYREILRHGVILSEFRPGTRAEPHHFPRRNRIIAALAADVIVVEASRRSGALITASFALELGREVHAVPGPIDRPTSAGTNRLIADGAGVIVGLEPEDGFVQPAGPLPPEPELRAILEAMPAHPVGVEEIAAAAGVPAEDAVASVALLELRGFIIPTRDGRVMRTPGRLAEPPG